MKRILKILGLAVLLMSMAYASNWDLPKEAISRTSDYCEALERYEEERGKTYRIVIGDDVYEGAYIEGMWYEPSELYQEVVDELLDERDN